MARKFRRKEEKPSFLSKKNMMSLFIIGIMVLSVLGFVMIRNDSGSYKFIYNDVLFKQTQQGYFAKIDDKTATFRYHPTQVEHINLSSSIITSLKSTRMAYITYDPDAKNPQNLALFSYELSQELPEYFGLYLVPGLSGENEYDVMIVTCLNATQFVPVIYLKYANETKVSMLNNCIYLEGKTDFDFAYLKDRVLYAMFDIIPAQEE